jgi:site-specific DNA-methyltransferase (adenine-specific)
MSTEPPFNSPRSFPVGVATTTPSEKPEGWTSDKWATPWPIVRDLERDFGRFDLDPCAEPQTAKAPTFYTPDDDGLSRPWFGRVFINPPYSRIAPWCERAVLETTTNTAVSLVVMLVPSATDTGWFHDLVWPYAELRFKRGRIKFLGWRGTPIPAPRSPSLFAIYRNANHE